MSDTTTPSRASAPLDVERIVALVQALRDELPDAFVHVGIHHLDRRRFDVIAGREDAFTNRENGVPDFWTKELWDRPWAPHTGVLIAELYTYEPPVSVEAKR